MVDLGLEDCIVGITKFCIHPTHLKQEKAIVGGTKNCNFKKIKDLKPTHILCNKEENTQEIVANCSKIATTHISDIYTVADVLQLINAYGTFFSTKTTAKQLITKIKSKHNSFIDFIKNKPPLHVAYFIWKAPWMVAASNTYINHLLELNNFKNIYANCNRYPEISIEDIGTNKNLDFILLSSEPYPFKEKHITEIKKINPKLKVMLVDGEMFSWPGSRLLKAFDYFKTLHNHL